MDKSYSIVFLKFIFTFVLGFSINVFGQGLTEDVKRPPKPHESGIGPETKYYDEARINDPKDQQPGVNPKNGFTLTNKGTEGGPDCTHSCPTPRADGNKANLVSNKGKLVDKGKPSINPDPKSKSSAEQEH